MGGPWSGEAHVRALLSSGLNAGSLRLHRLESSNIEDSDRVEVLAGRGYRRIVDEWNGM